MAATLRASESRTASLSGPASPLSLTSPQSFGVITTQLVPINRSFGSRAVQLGLRVEF